MPRNKSENPLRALRAYRDQIYRHLYGYIDWCHPNLADAHAGINREMRNSMAGMDARERLAWMDNKLKGSLYCPRGTKAS